MIEAPPPPSVSTAASTAVSAAAVSAQGTAARGAAPAASRLVWVALVVLGVVAAASLVLAWRADQRGASLEQELVRRQQESAAQSTEARMLARQAQQGMTDAAAKVALLEARVAEVAVQRTQLEELIQSMSRSRDENLLVDLEAAIRVALQQAAITGSAEPLVATLKQGDERLARYNQPRLEGVRRAIARDLDRVKALSVADMSSLAIKLDEATRMIDELPLVNQAYARKDESRSMAGVAAKAASTPGPTASTPAAWAGRVGLLFLIPGMGETLRVNGKACLIRDEEVLASLAVEGKHPLLGIAVEIEECFLQCAKAIIRSKLWESREGSCGTQLPCFAEILIDQTKFEGETVESLQRQIEDSYANNLD